MIELGIAQAQTQFTRLLGKTVTIVDKKARKKRAVIMPYEEYRKLLRQARTNTEQKHGAFDPYVGVLDKDFETDDARYQAITK